MKERGQALIILLLIGCSTPRKSERDNLRIVFDNPTEFFLEKKQSLSHEFGLLFEPVIDQLDSIKFYLLDSTVYSIDNDRKVFSLVIRGKASKKWSSCQKILVVSNTGQVVFESPLTQIDGSDLEPECGVPEYKIDSIFRANVAGKEYLLTQVMQHFYSCVGQPLTDLRILYVNSTDDYKQIDTLVTFKHIVGEDGTEQLRQSEFRTDKDGLSIRVKESTGEVMTLKLFDGGLRKEQK